MRKIKFRWWDDSRDKMCFPEKIKNDYNAEHEHLMQFTGLLDIDKEDIYEDDIVVQYGYPWFTEDNKPNYRGLVKWDCSSWQVILYCVNPEIRGISDGINENLNDNGIDENEKSNWIVIGNIHEDPELLNWK